MRAQAPQTAGHVGIIDVCPRVGKPVAVGRLLASHRRLSGFRRDPRTLPSTQEVIEESHTDKQSTLLVRTDGPILDPNWVVTPVTLNDLVLAYMRQARDGDREACSERQLAVLR